MMHPTDPDATPQSERRANVLSLQRIPWQAFHPTDRALAEAAKLAIVVKAIAGHDCYAYQPACGNAGRWTIWLATGNPGHDDRMTPAEWTARLVSERGPVWVASMHAN